MYINYIIDCHIPYTDPKKKKINCHIPTMSCANVSRIIMPLCLVLCHDYFHTS